MRLPASLAARGSAFFLAVALGTGATAPAGAIDVLDGLAPDDFRSPELARAEARATAPQRIAYDAAPADANPLGSTAGATTLTDLGVGSGATELAVTGAHEAELFGATTPEERRLLGTLAVVAAIDGLTGNGGIIDVEDLLGELDDVVDLPGDLLDDILDLDLSDGDLGVSLGGIELDLGGIGGLQPSEGTIVVLPLEDVGNILDDLPVDLPIRLPILLQ
jgi:hypothetical protein